MDATSPILLFDSDVGGLTVLAELRKLLPAAPVIYVADNAGLPYGDKTEAEIAARVCGLLGRLAERYHPRLICIACNTASTIALGMVRDVLEVPIVGTVPALKPAAELTKTKVIGLLGTRATINQPYVDRLERDHASDCRVLRAAAPQLVIAAEAKMRGASPDPAAFTDAAASLLCQSEGGAIDTVVLACTHFPLVRDELEAAFDPKVTFVDGAAGIAMRIAALCEGQPFKRARPDFALFTRDDPDLGQLLAAMAEFGIADLVTLS